MKYTLEILTVFESGKRVDADGHPHQEDCLYPTAEALTPAARLFVLCDGMGGHEAGEVASDAVCRAYGRVVEESKEWRNGRFPDSLLQAATTAAYDALDLLPETGQGRTPGTTMTLLALHEEGATVAHLGDSRVYHFRPGKTAEDTVLLFQTRDHSLVNQLLDLGELSPEEVENFPRRNVITRAMQPRLDVRFKPAVTHITDIRPGDYFMLCSDGILEHIEETNLRYVFSEEGETSPRSVTNSCEQRRRTVITIPPLSFESSESRAQADRPPRRFKTKTPPRRRNRTIPLNR